MYAHLFHVTMEISLHSVENIPRYTAATYLVMHAHMKPDIHGFCFFKLFPIGNIGLKHQMCTFPCINGSINTVHFSPRYDVMVSGHEPWCTELPFSFNPLTPAAFKSYVVSSISSC